MSEGTYTGSIESETETHFTIKVSDGTSGNKVWNWDKEFLRRGAQVGWSAVVTVTEEGTTVVVSES